MGRISWVFFVLRSLWYLIAHLLFWCSYDFLSCCCIPFLIKWENEHFWLFLIQANKLSTEFQFLPYIYIKHVSIYRSVGRSATSVQAEMSCTKLDCQETFMVPRGSILLIFVILSFTLAPSQHLHLRLWSKCLSKHEHKMLNLDSEHGKHYKHQHDTSVTVSMLACWC